MEASAGIAAARGVSFTVPSPQASRKEWRVVSDQSERSETERLKFGQSDERLIYEQGRDPADVEFCSITVDGSLDNDLLQQRLHTVVNQREELQRMETELRAQLIAKSEILEMRNTFDAQVKEQANANAKLQEQLHERGQKIYELERRLEENERELHAIRLDNEAAWVKEDLLREQSKELQTYRRERDNSEAERAQYIKQIHELQEHIQEKERQFIELQEQNRITQETIVYKDEQMREAQVWMGRVQEIDAFQQTEIRERTEQCSQLWIGCQRQAAEMERLHLHIQQLQMELTEARERNGTISDGSQVSKANSKDTTQVAKSDNSQLYESGNDAPGGNSGNLSNENDEKASSIAAANVSTQSDHLHGLPLAPSLLGMPTYIPPGQITALHPFLMHQQGISPSVPPHVPQSHVVHFHTVPASAMPSVQHWPNRQVAPDGSELSSHNQSPLQTESTLLRSNSSYQYESSVNGNAIHSEYLDANISQEIEPKDSVAHSSEGVHQVLQPAGENYLPDTQTQQILQHISSQFHDGLRLDSHEQNNEFQGKDVNSIAIPGLESQGLMTVEVSSAADISPSTIPEQVSNSIEKGTNSNSNAIPESLVSMGQKIAYAVKVAEPTLLDEQSLLACIVRTIPPGSSGRIRISTTLPNRLGKLLAPLHWHDYKKKYGKLDDFVASHPELFVVDGDYIQLREGAQEIIAATAAVAKVAAATAVSSLHPSRFHSVAVTPMAQSHRVKKNTDDILQFGAMQIQQSNGSFPNVKILAKPRAPMELKVSETRDPSSAQLAVGNGIKSDKNDLPSSQSKGSSHGRTSLNAHGKQQGGRVTVVPSNSRR